MARDQLMAFLNFVKPSMQAYSTFFNHKSAVMCSFCILFSFELSKDPLTVQWIKGWKIELPPQPWHSPNEDGWDVWAIVQYWSTQADNSKLNTVKLGFKALTLFGVSVYRCVSNMARLAQDKTIFLATSMWYQYFSTKELQLVKVFTQKGGISQDQCAQVCPVQALKAYIEWTSGHLYQPADLVYPVSTCFHVSSTQLVYQLTLPGRFTDLLSMDATNYGSYQGRP